MTIRIKRAFEDAAPGDGTRILVDRLWPRGLSKERARIDWWCKEIAPSPELRIWYGHDVAKWDEFRLRYVAELAANHVAVEAVREAFCRGPATLIYAKRDTAHSHAQVLKEFLEQYN